ncbi:MAG: thioredoxin-dependent thiol peroxidase [Candidatus Dadabacteria bacterium]|nr:MAG: thioredoxin-dependent thiol peroxidase [Candidatus Dadabacteria bacterium]
MTRLQPGQPAPEIRLLDQDQNAFQLSSLRGRTVLIYFYPKADTPGCTTQSRALQDALPELEARGVTVVGISPDEPEKLRAFADKYGLTFRLLSDPDHEVAEQWGTWGEKKMYGRSYMGIIRSMFLVDPEGNLQGVWYKISPKKTVPTALKALDQS